VKKVSKIIICILLIAVVATALACSTGEKTAGVGIDWAQLAGILSTTIAFTVPFMLIALGGMFSERSGVINLALEGIAIVGGLVGAITLERLFGSAAVFGAWAAKMPELAMIISLLLSGAAGSLFALLLGFAAIHLKADQTIGGTALNLLAVPVATLIIWAITAGASGSNFSYKSTPWRIISLERMGITTNSEVVRKLMQGFFITTPLAILILIIATVVLYKTRFGLRIRACGEHPHAADSVGINVYKMRYAGVLISGFLAGMGGFAYTQPQGATFANFGGIGFLALGIMIFGNWKPISIAGAAFLFALCRVVANSTNQIPFLAGLFKGANASEYLYRMLPFIITMLVLVIASRKSRAPKAEGIPYDKSTR